MVAQAIESLKARTSFPKLHEVAGKTLDQEARQ